MKWYEMCCIGRRRLATYCKMLEHVGASLAKPNDSPWSIFWFVFFILQRRARRHVSTFLVEISVPVSRFAFNWIHLHQLTAYDSVTPAWITHVHTTCGPSMSFLSSSSHLRDSLGVDFAARSDHFSSLKWCGGLWHSWGAWPVSPCLRCGPGSMMMLQQALKKVNGSMLQSTFQCYRHTARIGRENESYTFLICLVLRRGCPRLSGRSSSVLRHSTFIPALRKTYWLSQGIMLRLTSCSCFWAALIVLYCILLCGASFFVQQWSTMRGAWLLCLDLICWYYMILRCTMMYYVVF